ncbi:MAG TPA: hypothetical protein DCF68_17335, partial [Cyanothece sp. UBA12306]|nr:hypothetical protein [Cyanothece sp. UBA12306]
MKTLQSLRQHLEKWRRNGQNGSLPPLKKIDEPSKFTNPKTEYSSNIFQKLHDSIPLRKIHPPLMWSLAVVSLTSVIGYRFYNQPKLAVGTVAPTTILAPRDGTFEDTKTTEEKRNAVRTGIVPVLQRDLQLTNQLKLTLLDNLRQIENLRDVSRSFPVISGQKIPSSTQQYLRVASAEEWQIFAENTEKNPSNLSNLNPNLKKAVADFHRYSKTATESEVNAFLDKMRKSRQRYQQAQSKISTIRTPYLTPALIITFLNLDKSSWEVSKKAIINAADKILIQGLPAGMPDNLLKESVSVQLSPLLSSPTKKIATELLMAIFQNEHNLTVDKEETKRRAEQAAEAVEPVIVEIKRHDVIVKGGKVITQEEFVLLDSFGLSRRGINWLGLGITVILVGGGVSIFCVINRQIHRPMRRRDHLLLCLLSLSTPILAIFNLGYTNLPAIGLLTGSFYGPTLAVTQVLLLSGLSTFTAGTINWSFVLAGTAGGLLSAFMAGRLRSRDELARLGGVVGILQGSVYFLVYLIVAPVAGTIWWAVLPRAFFYGVSGFLWSVMALGISPYLERLFDLVTPIRLVELANPNCALLKRLSTETPGTFQHTLFVACLAEAAARELHCNVELVRAGTLYHDIGKMHDPLGFIENQMGAPNKHDQINDPWKSVEIIQKHVTEGLVMGKNRKLV